MKVNARQYAESLQAAKVDSELTAQELVSSLLALLKRKKQLHLTKKILAYLSEAEAVEKGMVEVTIETATSVDKKTEDLLITKAKDLYQGLQVKAHFQVKPELGSGFRIRGKDRQIDQSFTTHLAHLRKQLTRL